MTTQSEDESIDGCKKARDHSTSEQSIDLANFSRGSSKMISNNITKIVFISLTLTQICFHTIEADVVIISPTNQTADIFDNAELSFGIIPLEGLSGKVILSDPEDACSPLNIRPPTTHEKWFLLASRYPCKFETKVKSAAEAGFQAIIIYNVDPSNRQTATILTTSMTTTTLTLNGQKQKQISAGTSEVNTHIPTILISYIDGLDLKQDYLYDKGYRVLILPRIPFPLNAYLLPFAIVIVVCLFLMVSFLVFQIIKCIRDRRKLSRHRLTNKQLKQLLTTYYSKGSQFDTCAICLEEYTEGEKLRVLSCGHGYHLRCIDPWLTKSRRICPVCKGKVRVGGMDDISDTESESGHSPTQQQRNSSYNSANESTPLLRDQRPNPSRHLNQQQSPQTAPPQPAQSSGLNISQNMLLDSQSPRRHGMLAVSQVDQQLRSGPAHCSPDTSVNGSINGVYCNDNTSETSENNSRRLYVNAEQ